ncbi:hypothetical protein HG536_0E01140 [Torulaspora globosa]|uniref:Deacetylase sirtuin-type domain-containing protein n=1 Tax=Torulaspora globosa TaxID=48254 RepID=A0A7G3ZI67_9SACH|nr:uncharacterized protein HG536_0E01140 [Torulaspora globosa]QLL33203.1 hypothetical protein HG536_0E01140 [Torulaspora globosa]
MSQGEASTAQSGSSPANESDTRHLKSFHRYLKKARKVLCIVGAGLSQSSGIPTYQLQRGSWKGYTSLDLATPEAFDANPGLVWLFYSNRRYIAMRAKPNRGHYALAELAKRMRERRRSVLVVTQNVDGLQRRAGQAEQDLCELHGSLFDLRCTSFFCTYKGSNTRDLFLTPKLREFTPRDVGVKRKRAAELERSAKRARRGPAGPSGATASQASEPEETASSSDFDPLPHLDQEDLPHCPKCKTGLLRPGVVWFGEPLPLLQMDKVDAFFVQGNDDSTTPIDLVLVIGTSGKVWPAMGYVERCKQNGGRVAVFNTKIDDLDLVNRDNASWAFQGEASYWLPRALEPIIGKIYGPSSRRHYGTALP